MTPSDFDLGRPVMPGGPRLYLPSVEVIDRENALYADLPPEPEVVASEEWANQVADRADEDRALTDDMPADYCPRWWGPGL